MKNTARLQSRDRVEELRIALSGGAQKKYIDSLMQHYAKGAASPKAIEKARPKSVSTDKAFAALKGML